MKSNVVYMSFARAVVLAILVVGGLNAFAEDAFLRVETIPGESVDAVHPNEIEVLSYSLGVSNTVAFTSGGMQTGKATFKDFTVTKYLDKATPKLMLAAAAGQHLKQVVLTVRRSGSIKPFEYLKIILTDVIVTGVHDGGDRNSRATETVSFTYARIVVDYFSQKPDGSADAAVHFGWDLASGTSI